MISKSKGKGAHDAGLLKCNHGVIEKICAQCNPITAPPQPDQFKIIRPRIAGDVGRKKCQPVIIAIGDPLPPFDYNKTSLEEVGKFYQEQAQEIARALFDSLPQGTLERVLIELMKHRVGYYRGVTET